MSQAAPPPGKPSLKAATSHLWAVHWGVLGVVLLFVQACVRLGARTVDALAMPLSGLEVALSLFWVLFNAYGEGYRAFQLRFSPRVVQRAHALAQPSEARYRWLAPLYCMSMVGAPRRSRIIAWGSVVLIALAVAIMSQVPQPYRGIVDGGVVVALIWGILTMAYYHLRALRSGELQPVAPSRRERNAALQPASAEPSPRAGSVG